MARTLSCETTRAAAMDGRHYGFGAAAPLALDLRGSSYPRPRLSRSDARSAYCRGFRPRADARARGRPDSGARRFPAAVPVKAAIESGCVRGDWSRAVCKIRAILLESKAMIVAKVNSALVPLAHQALPSSGPERITVSRPWMRVDEQSGLSRVKHRTLPLARAVSDRGGPTWLRSVLQRVCRFSAAGTVIVEMCSLAHVQELQR